MEMVKDNLSTKEDNWQSQRAAGAQ